MFGVFFIETWLPASFLFLLQYSFLKKKQKTFTMLVNYF